MRRVPLVRAVHLNVYLDVLRDIGAPVERLLEKAGLPATVEETPNSYLCVPRVLDCVARSGGRDAANELGFLAARRLRLCDLRPEFRNAVLSAPTCKQRLLAIIRHAPREDGGLVSGFIDEGKNVRIFCDLHEFRTSPALAYSEWLQLRGIIHVVQSVAGPAWSPEEITLVSRHQPSQAARDAYLNTRILTSQPHTSFLVPRVFLGLPCRPGSEAGGEADDEGDQFSPAKAIREIVKPYLRDRPLSLAEVAEMLGMSQRSVQRHLGDLGLSFSTLVAEARYEVAREALSHADCKIIDAAFAAGYAHQSHLTRAFRRMAGITPQMFRKANRIAP